MEIVIYIYFAINLFLAGMSVDTSFNTRRENLISVSILFFFGGILVVYEYTIADVIRNWKDSTQLGFWWKMNVQKRYNNLDKKYITFIENQIKLEKLNENYNKKLVKQLERILKRNGIFAEKD